MTGKQHRLSRFQYPHSKRGLIVPIDHGLTVGPLPGLESVRKMREWIHSPAICGVIAHKGIAERLLQSGALEGKGLLVHLNGMSTLSSDPDTKERLTSIETAMRLGADGVSFQVNFSGTNDSENLRAMGKIVDEASDFGLPVLAMVYDKVTTNPKNTVTRLRHLIRAAVEMGCDAVKIAPPSQLELLPEMLADVSEDIRIYLAGGSLATEVELMTLTRAALRAGAQGLCVGRNVFQRTDARDTLERLREVLEPRPLTLSQAHVPEAMYGAH